MRASGHRRDRLPLNNDAWRWGEQIPHGIQDDLACVRRGSGHEAREQHEADAENGDGRSVTAHRAKSEAILGELFDE